MHQQLAFPPPTSPAGPELPVHGEFAELSPESELCQRWRYRRHSWTSRSAGGFTAENYQVLAIEERVAKPYVLAHHYSGTYPAAARRFGLFLDTGEGLDLVGVAVFGIPPSAAVLTNVFPDLEPYVQSLELSRFVLEGDAADPPLSGSGGRHTPPPHPGRAPGNAESWFLARCLEHLAAADVRGVVMFADPVPRQVGPRIVHPGHIGTIYQASNAVFTGRGTPRTLTLLPDGSILSDRAMQKVRKGEGEYVERRLVGLGARPPRAEVRPADWLTDALNDLGAVRMRHRGCLRYAIATSRRNRRRVTIAGTAQPYPKRLAPAQGHRS